jgi:hypothetical protein
VLEEYDEIENDRNLACLQVNTDYHQEQSHPLEEPYWVGWLCSSFLNSQGSFAFRHLIHGAMQDST